MGSRYRMDLKARYYNTDQRLDTSVFYADDPNDFFSIKPSKKNMENSKIDDLRNEILHDRFCSSRKHKKDSFYGCVPSEGKSYLIGDDQWDEGVERVSNLRDSVNLKSRAQYTFVRKLSHGEEGYDLDVDRFRDFDFENMWISMRSTAKKKRGTKKVIRFVQLGTDSWKVKPDKFIWNGIALSAIADICEAAGIRTWITMMWGVTDLCQRRPKNHENSFVYFLDVKEPSNKLDLAHLVTWTSHPCASRVGVFTARLAEKWMVKPDYGTCMDNSEAKRYAGKVLDMEGFNEFIFVPRMYSEREAVEFVSKVLVEVGIADQD